MKKTDHHFARHWDLYVIFIFIVAKIVISFGQEIVFLFWPMLCAYVIFLFLLARKVRFFSTLFVLFLTLDSMMVTYLGATIGFSAFYYWMLGLNFVVIALVVQNVHKDFPR